MKKHIISKHKNIKTCTLCEKQFDYEKYLETHMHQDHNHSGVNLNDSQKSNNDLDIRLEQLEDDELDGESEVSIDEARMEAFDREMNPGDYN